MAKFVENQKVAQELKTMREENKIMAMNLSSIDDPQSRAYFQAERKHIL